jgi:hypothetical protein
MGLKEQTNHPVRVLIFNYFYLCYSPLDYNLQRNAPVERGNLLRWCKRLYNS